MIRTSIEVWVFAPTTDAFLILEVQNDEYHFWQPITGGIEANETAQAAAIREIFEETGLRLQLSDLTELGQQTVEIDAQLTIQKTVYLAKTQTTTVVLAPEEHVGFQWLTDPETIRQTLKWPNNLASFDWALAMLAK